MKTVCVAIFLFISTSVLGQSANDYWASWDKNYRKANGTTLLNAEKAYAEYVENHPEIAQYYVRQDSYRFVAEYIGKTRPLNTLVRESMYRAYTLTMRRDIKELGDIYKAEALFKIGYETLWMPIQVNILKGLKKEVVKGDKITLYCFFFE
jgi:hypothetical protein